MRQASLQWSALTSDGRRPGFFVRQVDVGQMARKDRYDDALRKASNVPRLWAAFPETYAQLKNSLTYEVVRCF